MNSLSSAAAFLLAKAIRGSATLELLDLTGLNLGAGWGEIFKACAEVRTMKQLRASCWWAGSVVLDAASVSAQIGLLMQVTTL